MVAQVPHCTITCGKRRRPRRVRLLSALGFAFSVLSLVSGCAGQPRFAAGLPTADAQPSGYLLGSCYGRTIGLLELRTGMCELMLKFPTWGCVYSPKASALYYADDSNGKIMRWVSGEPQPTVLWQWEERLYAEYMSLSPSEAILALQLSISPFSRTDLVVIDIGAGSAKRFPLAPSSMLGVPSWVTEERLLVSLNGSVDELSVRSGKFQEAFSAPFYTYCVLSPDKKRLLAVELDKKVEVMDYPSLANRRQLPSEVLVPARSRIYFAGNDWLVFPCRSENGAWWLGMWAYHLPTGGVRKISSATVTKNAHYHPHKPVWQLPRKPK